MDILDQLKDLHKQATKERSHYYVGSIVEKSIAEITALRARVQQIGDEYDSLLRHLDSGGSHFEFIGNIIKKRNASYVTPARPK